MQEIRYLDKLIDELAKGKSMDKYFERNKDNFDITLPTSTITQGKCKI